MIEPVRKTLSLKKTSSKQQQHNPLASNDEYSGEEPEHADALEPKEILLDRFHILLPCRSYQVTYKVAEQGGMSLTSEFLLRLLHAVEGGMDDERIAQFFGFNQRELTFVLNEVLTRDYVIREEGRLRLTSVGRGLFSTNNGAPHIVTVEKRISNFGFDAISLCGQEIKHLDPFTLSLPALEAKNRTAIANPSEHIRQVAFRRSFAQFDLSRRNGLSLTQQHLYSVDSVIADKRFLAVVPVRVVSLGGDSANIQVDLSEWHTGHELEDREMVSNEITNLVDSIVTQKSAQDEWAYKQLLVMAPVYLQRFKRRDALVVDRFHQHALKATAEPRADRPTVPLIGSIFTPPNIERLTSALKYGARTLAKTINQHEALAQVLAQNQHSIPVDETLQEIPAPPEWPRQLYWLTPVKHWGQTQTLPRTLELIRQSVQQAANAPLEEWTTIAVRPQADRTASRPPKWLNKAFSKITYLSLQEMPANSLEILYVPNLVAAALVHAPISPSTGGLRGFPVPLGFLSFDPEVVSQAGRYFESLTDLGLSSDRK